LFYDIFNHFHAIYIYIHIYVWSCIYLEDILLLIYTSMDWQNDTITWNTWWFHLSETRKPSRTEVIVSESRSNISTCGQLSVAEISDMLYTFTYRIKPVSLYSVIFSQIITMAYLFYTRLNHFFPRLVKTTNRLPLYKLSLPM
jgi:hypothetical protein